MSEIWAEIDIDYIFDDILEEKWNFAESQIFGYVIHVQILFCLVLLVNNKQ